LVHAETDRGGLSTALPSRAGMRSVRDGAHDVWGSASGYRAVRAAAAVVTGTCIRKQLRGQY